MTAQLQTFDIAIVGGGPTGSALALALRDSGLAVALLDARADDTPRADARVLALGEAAKQTLARFGAWRRLETMTVDGVPAAQTVSEVRICQQKGAGLARFLARDVAADALGYLVSMPALQEALDATLRETLAMPGNTLSRHFAARVQAVDVKDDRAIVSVLRHDTAFTLAASLLAFADGSGALLPVSSTAADDDAKISNGKEEARKANARRHYDYAQSAVLARLTCAAPLENAAHAPVAYEYFTEQGPLALLPYRDTAGATYRLVWTVDTAGAERLATLPNAHFCAHLNSVLGRVCRTTGRILRADDRQTVPLQLDYAEKITGPHAVVLGNAAQRLHPVGAQGFNLALRDVAALARTVQAFSHDRSALGTALFLRHYAAQRRDDRAFAFAFSHGMAQLLGHDTLLTRLPRAVALSALDALPPLRRWAARTLIYGRE